MSHTAEAPQTYYPETNYDCSFYYQNEVTDMQGPMHKTNSLNLKNKKGPVPTINYINERKCPIYVHQMRYDSSVCNMYNEKIALGRKMAEYQKPPPPGSHNLLDKLEETYWATWKPKKGEKPEKKVRVPGKLAHFCDFSDTRPIFQEHKSGHKEEVNKPHGDVHDDIIKHFKAKRFETSSTDTVGQERTFSHTKRERKIERPGNACRIELYKQPSMSQEIQTEVHCPVILQESPQEDKGEKEEESELQVNEQPPENQLKPKIKEGKRKSLNMKVEESSQNEPETCDSLQTFVEHKDSVEITKKKQEKEGANKQHFKQPKCIRLYRKSGVSTGYIKGGTYPLKSCLKNEGSFRLGPPGSPLFITTSSYSNRKRK